MDLARQRVIEVNIEEEVKKSFIDYAMSVIVSRALPDVRDGLKPVHRRILYSMFELGLTPDKPYRKSARIVGDVLGKYHPHGDAAVYEAMVRMAQDFSIRYPLVDGHGNFGSIDGDSPAAMRYTEARLSKIAMELMADIGKETVDFMPNFDETLKEPTVLPSKFPNLLVNGSSGIAVGMATNIPPHNLGEVIDGTIALIDNPDITIEQLMKYIKGPDFPTGGIILGQEGIKEAYATGKGRIVTRAKAEIEEMNNGRSRIVVTEIPYQVNKAKLIERIAELVRDKSIEGISDIRDESDKSGMRIVIELKKDANPTVVLNYLYKHTQMQETFGVIMLALVDGQPKILNLKEMLTYYILHQKDVITRRTRHDLDRAQARAHILEGLLVALDHIDAVISLIRNSRTVQIAKEGLMEKFSLTEKQAQAILDMRLQRLTGLEREKVEQEYAELQNTIKYLQDVLANERMVYNIIKEELLAIKEKYEDERRTKISLTAEEIEAEDLIQEEDVVITLTHYGYVKRTPLSVYKIQHRGGRGIVALQTREDDFVEDIYVTSTHDRLLFFSSHGKVYELKAYEIPEAGRQARGTPIINLIQVASGERIQAVIPIREADDNRYIMMATRNGYVKKCALDEFLNIRKGGLVAITLKEDDQLIQAQLTDGNKEIIMASHKGMAIRFHESEVRPMGRTAMGVKGMELEEGDHVIGMELVREGAYVLSISENGYGKKTRVDEYRVQGRGGKGIITMNITKKTGKLVALKVVTDDDDLMIINSEGTVIRIDSREVANTGRNTQGVILMKLDEGASVVSVAKVKRSEE
ncbi:DNA gyrase subunit A [Caldicoprobacter guelmensis]|uniref:DNA gyrase subunit A n=1 Tax=Caldicoprobacter guelmensis TaxID=1170224 RepID=UPI0019571DD8|nr:DNA gyrase subunit A [Caldicoprobacter guelmensis]MBM7583276.1 DNA gyrase subunit A [Caldicoprobacter guelmensis]